MKPGSVCGECHWWGDPGENLPERLCRSFDRDRERGFAYALNRPPSLRGTRFTRFEELACADGEAIRRSDAP